jgi:hypothetical protein
VSTKTKQVSDVPGAPGDNRIKPVRQVTDNQLEPLPNYLRIREAELTDNRRQERNSSPARLHHRQADLGIDELQRDARNSSTRSDVQDFSRLARKNTLEQQAIQEDVLHDPPGVSATEQTVDGLPFHQ